MAVIRGSVHTLAGNNRIMVDEVCKAVGLLEAVVVVGNEWDIGSCLVRLEK